MGKIELAKQELAEIRRICGTPARNMSSSTRLSKPPSSRQAASGSLVDSEGSDVLSTPGGVGGVILV
jgi:hypothetical protein